MTRATPPQSARDLSQREFRAITQKGRGEIFLFSQYVYRPISTWVTRLYAALGVGANGATLHSLAAALAAAAALLWPRAETFLLAALGLQLYFVLDHVDGELARLDFWRGVRRPTPDGEYADYWVHLHSLNLAFAALGVGLTLSTGHLVWAVLGIVADNCLGSFPKLAMGRILWCAYRRDPSLTSHPAFASALAVVTDTDGTQIMSGTLSRRQRIVHAARELLFYPGCLIVLSVVLSIDGVTSLVSGRFTATWSSVYLAGFAAVGVVSKVRRTVLSARQLRRLGEPVQPPASAGASDRLSHPLAAPRAGD